jgi:hypothetical protein
MEEGETTAATTTAAAAATTTTTTQFIFMQNGLKFSATSGHKNFLRILRLSI